MEVYDYTPQLMTRVLASIRKDAERETAQRIVEHFADAGLKIVVKHMAPGKPTAHYRVFCHNESGGETVIVNTNEDDGHHNLTDEMVLQLRIDNREIFERESVFTPSVGRQITNAEDCRYCAPHCKDKRYAFTFNDRDYVKCHYYTSSFRLKTLSAADTDCVMAIIESEVAYAQRVMTQA